MDGTVIPLPAPGPTSGPTQDGERRSPARPAGLPILSTEPLTAAEREALREAARIIRLIAQALDEALEANRVDRALWAVTHGADAGQVLVDLAARFGSNR